MIQINNGRPTNTQNRPEKEIKVYNLLDKLGIEYICADHEQADTMEACLEIDKALEVTMCKNLFLCNRQKTNFYLLMMPGDKPFKTKELSSQINSARLSFAGAEEMEKYLNIKPGSVSVLGLMNDVENKVNLLVDEEILKDEYIGCHPCVNTSSIKIKTADIFDKFLNEVNHSFVVVKLIGE